MNTPALHGSLVFVLPLVAAGDLTFTRAGLALLLVGLLNDGRWPLDIEPFTPLPRFTLIKHENGLRNSKTNEKRYGSYIPRGR